MLLDVKKIIKAGSVCVALRVCEVKISSVNVQYDKKEEETIESLSLIFIIHLLLSFIYYHLRKLPFLTAKLLT